MRLADIRQSRATVSEQMPVLASEEGQPAMAPFHLIRESPKRIFVRQIALGVLQALQGHFRKRLGFDLPYPWDILCVGDAFFKRRFSGYVSPPDKKLAYPFRDGPRLLNRRRGYALLAPARGETHGGDRPHEPSGRLAKGRQSV